MSENNEGEENVRKGNDWEVVALTESAYAAAPGPNQDILNKSNISPSEDENSETTGSGTMFMSSHFGLLPSMHENLPIEPEYEEKHHAKGWDSDVPIPTDVKHEEDIKHEEDMHIEDVHVEEDKSSELPDFPCEVRWRKHAVSLYGRVKNANPYWSIVVAAAVVGLVIIGHRWQRDKPEGFHLKSQLIIDDEGFSRSQSH